MTLFGLAVRNAFVRNKTRSFLTILGTTVAALAFVFLRTVLGAWYANSNASASDRLVTRNAISITQPLPLSYAARIGAVPGVARVNWANWFGGIYKDRRNFFAQFAIDGQSLFEVFDLRVVKGSKEDFLNDRNSCLVGSRLAAKYGWKVGDTVPLEGDIYPGEWRFKIAGFVEAEDSSIAQTMYFHWKRLNESLPDARKDQIGLITSKVANASDSPRVIKAIDDTFVNSDNETHTETEKSFRLSFVAGSSAILQALQVVSLVILVIMALILGNTLSMGLRERTAELGAMRAIGFLPRQIRMISIAEGAMLGLAGGLTGVLLANPLLNGFGKALSDFGFLSGLGFDPLTASITLGAALLIGALASAIPAFGAARMPVVAALRRQE